jgi:hypothetical protein
MTKKRVTLPRVPLLISVDSLVSNNNISKLLLVTKPQKNRKTSSTCFEETNCSESKFTS